MRPKPRSPEPGSPVRTAHARDCIGDAESSSFMSQELDSGDCDFTSLGGILLCTIAVHSRDVNETLGYEMRPRPFHNSTRPRRDRDLARPRTRPFLRPLACAIMANF